MENTGYRGSGINGKPGKREGDTGSQLPGIQSPGLWATSTQKERTLAWGKRPNHQSEGRDLASPVPTPTHFRNSFPSPEGKARSPLGPTSGLSFRPASPVSYPLLTILEQSPAQTTSQLSYPPCIPIFPGDPLSWPSSHHPLPLVTLNETKLTDSHVLPTSPISLFRVHLFRALSYMASPSAPEEILPLPIQKPC